MDLMQAVRRSVYCDRMLELLEQPQAGKEIIQDPVVYGFSLKSVYSPNCYGTVLYVVGAEHLVPDLVTGYAKAIFPFDGRIRGPGYVSGSVMAEFLMNYTQPADQGIVCVRYAWMDAEARLQHVGIFLGEEDGEVWMFNQRDFGGEYGFDTISQYLHRHDVASGALVDIRQFSPVPVSLRP